MSLKQYKNINDINTQVKQQRGVRYSELMNMELPSYDIFSNFASNANDVLELHVYDANNTYIKSNQTVLDYSISDLSPTYENKPTVLLNVQKDLIDLQLPNSKYKVVYNFMRNLLGGFNSVNQYLYIENISADRTELRVYPVTLEDKEYSDTIIRFATINKSLYNYWPDAVMNFSKNIIVPIINWQLDTFTTPDYPYSLLLKLYEPLPSSLKEKDLFWIATEVANPIIDFAELQVPIIPAPTNLVNLKSANFNLDLVQKVGYDTDYKSWNDVLGTNPVSSQQLINVYLNDLSGSIKGIELNIDYSDYNNFIHFSSATERLNNFKYKLQLIEEYNIRMYELQTMASSSTSTPVLNAISQSQDKINQVMSTFDGFENYMYYESGSTYVNSFGVVIDRTWPKQNSTKPYILQPTTSSIATTWFENEVASAIEYDTNNRDSLVESIPMHIRSKENEDGTYANESYMLFVNMIAQHYDIMWLYINNLTESYNKEQKLTQGIAKDLIYHFVESFGWDLDDGITIDGLWETALGMDENDTYITGSNGLEYITPQDRQKEIWKRIYNNLPLLLKEKGTARGIKALISCYGVPSTILRIKEYGGTTYENSEYEIDKYTNALIFNSQSISVPSIANTKTIQFRFKPYSGSLLQASQSILSSSLFNVGLYYSGSVYGQLVYNGTSSIQLPLFDGNYWNVMMTRNTAPNIYLYRFNNDRFTYQWSGSMTPAISPTNIQLGVSGSGTTYYSGSMQEFRIWNTVLSEYEFQAYCKNPEAYFTNSPTSSYNALALRYSLSDPNYYMSGSVVSSSYDVYDYNPTQIINYGTASALLTSASFESFIDVRHIKTPKYWGNKINSDKVRIENASLEGNLNLIKKNEVFGDRAYDSAKLGINFSPIDMTNEDIFAQMGDFVLDNYIGNPIDQFKPTYYDLDKLREFYFSKYSRPNNIYDYVKYIKLYDKSLFKQIKKLLPERNNAVVGLSYESHILERPKYEWKPVTITSESKSDSISYEILPKSEVIGQNTMNNEYLTYFTMTGSNIQMDSQIENDVKIIGIDSKNIGVDANITKHQYEIISTIPSTISDTLGVWSYYSSSGKFGDIVDTPRPSVFSTKIEKFNEVKYLYYNNIDLDYLNYYFPNKIPHGTFGVQSTYAPTALSANKMHAHEVKRFFINTTDIIKDRNNIFLNYLTDPSVSGITKYLHVNKTIQNSIDEKLNSNTTALYKILAPATMSYTLASYVGYTINSISGNTVFLDTTFGDISSQFRLGDECDTSTNAGPGYIFNGNFLIVSESYYSASYTAITFKTPPITGIGPVLVNKMNLPGRHFSADTELSPGIVYSNNIIEIPVQFITYYSDVFGFPELSGETTSQYELYFYSQQTVKSEIFSNYYGTKHYNGFLNTSNTTIDKKEPVEVFRVVSPIDSTVGDKLDNITDGLEIV